MVVAGRLINQMGDESHSFGLLSPRHGIVLWVRSLCSLGLGVV